MAVTDKVPERNGRKRIEYDLLISYPTDGIALLQGHVSVCTSCSFFNFNKVQTCHLQASVSKPKSRNLESEETAICQDRGFNLIQN